MTEEEKELKEKFEIIMGEIVPEKLDNLVFWQKIYIFMFKQQEEIKELKNEIKKLKIEITKNDYVDLNKLALNYRLYKDLAYEYQGNYISKNTIREKIKELDELQKKSNLTGLITEYQIKIQVLEELLGE